MIPASMAVGIGSQSSENLTKTKKHLPLAEVLTSLGLFLLALFPRAYDLYRFVTADEAKWVYRSAQFLAAFLRGDFAATSVNLTPAVTTTWLGSLGLAFYYWLNEAAINIPLAGWLTSLPEFRTEMSVLVATRWPVVILTSLAVVALYHLTRRLFNPILAFIAAAFVALDPHTVALSRILGHDAPAAVFMSLSLLLLLLAISPGPKHTSKEEAQISSLPPRPLAPLLPFTLSGVMAGLAFLSKAPALFLIPFAGLVFFSKVWANSTTLYFWFKRFLLWAVAAYLIFIAFWPAAWVDPLGRPLAVVENAFLSATDQEEADAEGYWLVPDLGPLYYPVNGAFKLSPLVMVGAGLAVIFVVKNRRNSESVSGEWLLAFVLLFTIFMTLGDKRSARYILPAFPPLAVVAAFGWLKLYQVSGIRYQVSNVRPRVSRITYYALRLMDYEPRLILPAVLTLSALAILLPYAPYYFTYFNPLLGGPYTAPHLVKIGWGEGLDQVGRFLQRNAGLRESRVGTGYAATIAPFFKGDLSSVTGSNLDYVVLYSKQVQSGEPSPAFVRYFEQFDPVLSVELNGLHYADLYPGPAVQPALALTPGLDSPILPKPIGFRPLTPYGRIGQALEVDVLWLADEPLPTAPSVVTLEPVSVLDISHAGHRHESIDNASSLKRGTEVLAQGQGYLTLLADGLIVSRHRLMVPTGLSRGFYALLVDGRPLGEIELRYFQIPPDMSRVDEVVFDEQIALAAYRFEPADDYVAVTLAWQAQKSRLPDYTVFVQLLDAETNERQAGVDTEPLKGDWPTGRWVKGEVVVDEYSVPVPPGLSAGYYQIIVGLYRPETGQRLALAGGRDHWTLPWTLIREK